MSMLAEKRSKTRYLIHSAKTNSKWLEDESNMGRKLLSKMGWKPGQGLGVNADGRVDPLHVKYKCDNRGLGCTNSSEIDIAVGQQKDFDAFLVTLSNEALNDKGESPCAVVEANSSTDRSTTSLELQSQKSRARVHYHKFTRGKDLSRASSKDLASILGMSDPSAAKVQPPPTAVIPAVGPELSFNLHESSGSSADYFAKKLKKRKMHWEPLNESSSIKKKNDGDYENEENSCEGTPGLDSTLQDGSSSKGRRKSVTWGEVEVSFVTKYIKDMGDTSTESVNEDTFEEVESTDTTEETCGSVNEKKKKKKKRKDLEKNISDKIIESNKMDCDQLGTPKKKKEKKINFSETDELNNSHVDDKLNGLVAEESDPNVRGKKKSKKGGIHSEERNADEHCNNMNLTPSTEVIEIDYSTPLKKKHKKKKSVHEDVQEEIASVLDHRNSKVSSVDDTLPKKHKKQKKDKCENLNDSSTLTVLGESLNLSTVSKKKKKKYLSIPDEDTSVNAIVETNSIEASADYQNKKKRKRVELEQNCPEVEITAECLNDSAIKKKKKKKKTEDIEVGDSVDVLKDIIPISKESSKEKRDKKKRKEEVSHHREVKEESKILASEPSSKASLSALTQERMAKWKDRRQNKDSNGEEKLNKQGTLPTKALVDNSHLMVQDYHYRKVLATLGYNVKQGIDKNLVVQMPPSNFHGSNLDSIQGYRKPIMS